MSDFNLQAKGLFGRYCIIEMFRYGVPNEYYLHKIVSQSRRNIYCDVPLRWDSKPVGHPAKEGVSFPDSLEEVIWVVQCGIDETKVFPVALKDVEVLGEGFNESEQEKVIEYLRQENADWEDRYRALVAESDKLRKLCERFAEYVSQDRCEGCVSKRRCNEGDIDECWQRTEIRDMAHDVGIEVDE